MEAAFSRIEDALGSRDTSRLMMIIAGAEMVADKLPFIPDRTDAVPLVGRAVVGSMMATAFAAHRGRSILLPAIIGATAAIASAYAGFHVRRLAAERLRIPDQLLGMLEDAVVVAASKRISDVMEAERAAAG